MFTFFRQIALRGSHDPRSQALRALERGDPAGAERILDVLLQAETLAAAERAFLLNKRGVAKVRQDRRSDALIDFAGALEVLPRYAPALVNVGNMLLEDGDAQEAIAHYESAIVADASYPPAHHNLGVAYKRIGRLDDAVRSLRRAQRLEGRFRLTPSKRP